MIKKVTIKSVKFAESKFGTTEKYTYKKGKNAGKNFQMVTIQTNETGDDYYSTPAMEGEKPLTIQEGQSLLLNFTETTSDDGQKVFKNFNFPTKDQLAEYANSL